MHVQFDIVVNKKKLTLCSAFFLSIIFCFQSGTGLGLLFPIEKQMTKIHKICARRMQSLEQIALKALAAIEAQVTALTSLLI